MSDESVSQWITDLKEGDPAAARLLWDRYFERLVGLARKRLGNVPKRVGDEEDVAVSIFKSLCNGAVNGRFEGINDRDDLWRLLVAVTRQKTVDFIRRHTAQRRGGGRVRGESVFMNAGEGEDAGGIDAFAVGGPTPEFLAELSEESSRLMNLLRDDTLRNAALWRMEGYSNEEIADKLGIGVRAVERKLKLIREKWSRELSQ